MTAKNDIAEEDERPYHWESDSVVGPDGFECKGNSPAAIMQRLNEQHEEIEQLRKEKKRLREMIIRLFGGPTEVEEWTKAAHEKLEETERLREENERLKERAASWEEKAVELAEINGRERAILGGIIVGFHGKNERGDAQKDVAKNLSDAISQRAMEVVKAFVKNGYFDAENLK
jgi:hypothetical protein